MTYAPHYRLTMSGYLWTPGDEQFSMTLSLSRFQLGALDRALNDIETGIGGPLDVDNNQFADLVQDCRNFFKRPATNISPYGHLTQVKLAWIGADGKYLKDPMIADGFTELGGGAAVPLYPPQISLAVSLHTGRRGPSGRGRFYLPAPAVALPQNYQIATTTRDDIAGSVVTFLNDLANEPGVDVLGLAPVVASSKGYNSVVTGVRVGRVLDTVRSRRTSLHEDYEPPVAVTF